MMAFQRLGQCNSDEFCEKGLVLQIYADGVLLNEEVQTLAKVRVQVQPSVVTWLDSVRSETLAVLSNTSTPNSASTIVKSPNPTGTRATGAAPTETSTLGIPPRKAYRHSFTIEEQYDRIKGVTTVTLYPSTDFRKWSDRPSNLLVRYEYPGTQATSPKVVAFMLSSLVWYYESCYDVTLLLSGQSRIRPTAILSNQILPGQAHTNTFITSLLPLEDFLRIVNSTQVEGEVCNVKFALSQEQIEALRDLASRMNP